MSFTFAKLLRRIRRSARETQFLRLHHKFQQFTMVPETQFLANLELCLEHAPMTGCIVECGVWRGGMSAAMAEVLPGRRHLLFDSFEGLPPARDTDGPAALNYQSDKTSPHYFDNCRAESSFAKRAMSMSPARDARLIRGWFSETLPTFISSEPIAVLRLNSDWYDSTMDCLTYLYPQVMRGGLILVDDYFTWDGCSRAVHDYLSKHKLTDRIREFNGVCFFVKNEPAKEGIDEATKRNDESPTERTSAALR